MYTRLAGRLLTSPLAFLVAGIVDFALFAGAAIGRAVGSVPHRVRRGAPNLDAR